MSITKVNCCCGAGIGSSLMASMNVQKVLKDMGHPEIEVTHSSLSMAAPKENELVVVGRDLESAVDKYPNKIVLNNLMDKKELREKLNVYFD